MLAWSTVLYQEQIGDFVVIVDWKPELKVVPQKRNQTESDGQIRDRFRWRRVSPIQFMILSTTLLEMSNPSCYQSQFPFFFRNDLQYHRLSCRSDSNCFILGGQ